MSKNIGLSPEIMVEALKRVQHEIRFHCCKPLEDPEAIEQVVQLAGVDFAAGDVAVAAVRGGIDPLAVVDFFAEEVRQLACAWTRAMNRDEKKEEERAPEWAAGWHVRENIEKETFDAFQALGMADMAKRIDHDLICNYVVNVYMDRLDRESAIVQAARMVFAFAYELRGGSEDRDMTVEMHGRGLTRALVYVGEVSGTAYDPRAMLEKLQKHLSKERANGRGSAAATRRRSRAGRREA